MNSNITKHIINKNANKNIVNRNHLKSDDTNRKLGEFNLNYSNVIDFSNRKSIKQQWPNSVYSYNSNYEKNLPVLLNMTYDLIKSYLFLYSNKIESSIGLRRLWVKSRRSKTNRIFVSKPTLKHTSTSVLITTYVYNRQKIYLNNKLKQLDELTQLINLIDSKQHVGNIRKILKMRHFDVLDKKLELKDDLNHVHKGLALLEKVSNEKNLLDKSFILPGNSFKLFEAQLLNSFLKKILYQQIHKMYYKQLFLLNKLKFQDVYLLRLKQLLSKLFNKKIEFNFIDLKSFYLNSDIFTDVISLVLRNRESSAIKVLSKSIQDVKFNPYNKLTDSPNLQNKSKPLFSNEILYINAKLLSKNNVVNNTAGYKDIADGLINGIFNQQNKQTNSFFIENKVLSDLKFKTISGITIKAKGRLTRRLVAARSVYKTMTKGSLKNIDSSYRGLYSPVLFGHSRSNVQFSRSHYKNRNGSFGIKGWISSK